MRVTENMRFNSMINNIFSAQSQYDAISEKVATEKNINQASDDPIGATKILNIRKGMAENAQYEKNIETCNTWLSTAESTLSSASDLLVSAQEIAVGQATATATAATRTNAAASVESIIEEMQNLANTKQGDHYLFSGTRNDTAPFSAEQMNATIEAAKAVSGNTFSGTAISGGAYTANVNNTYALKITNAGALAAATCQISTDGGKTWNGVDLSMASGTVNLGDGVSLTFDDAGGTKAFGKNDVFYVNAVTSGYYKGNSEELSLSINRGTSFTYNLNGEDVFTAAGSSGVDIFKTLNDLKDALNNNDAQGISDQIDNLQNAQSQITLNQSLCGTKENHLDTTKSNLADLDTQLTSTLSDTQDADMASLATQLSQKQLALEASYSIAAQIGQLTILNYLTTTTAL